MIGKLTGTISHIDLGFVILDVSGVGYKVNLTNDSLGKIRQNKEVSLWIHHAVRENSVDLYGFSEQNEQEFFELLLGVSGIGPKSALGVLSITSVDTLKKAVQAGDITYLTKVSGIGKKNAEKIIVELRDKLGALEDGAYALSGDADTLEALTSLGYSAKEARDALRDLSDDIKDTGERVKAALKKLSS
jgi:Holliday junction DNA helicase RuvA